MPCPVCGRVMCDCSPVARGQTQEDMMREYHRDVQQKTKEEQEEDNQKDKKEDK